MKTIIYLITVSIGILLSIPITIAIIAWQQAESDVVKIREHFEK
jgi:uncharacterized membrane protein